MVLKWRKNYKKLREQCDDWQLLANKYRDTLRKELRENTDLREQIEHLEKIILKGTGSSKNARIKSISKSLPMVIYDSYYNYDDEEFEFIKNNAIDGLLEKVKPYVQIDKSKQGQITASIVVILD